MKTYNISEIAEGSYFSKDLYLDEKFLLLIPEQAVTVRLKNLLSQWNFQTVSSEGENIAASVTEEVAEINTTIEPIKNKGENDVTQKRLDELSTKVETQYREFLDQIEKIHNMAKNGLNLNVSNVSDIARDLTDFINKNKKQILLVDVAKFADSYDYTIIHEFRSTVFAVMIGIYLKFPSYKLIELATACVIHEVGMARIPASVYNSTEPLTMKEKQALLTHPIISYNIVNASSFSRPICLACLEHHERENGSGYPRRLSSNRISLYGKIIALACSYEAATSARPYRDARNPTTSIMELVRNENKQYDDTILKALLYSISFFPIGMYVVLSNGRAAQVIDVNPDDPRFPIVQLLGERKQDDSPKIFGTTKDGLYITRSITKEEALEMENALEMKEESEI